MALQEPSLVSGSYRGPIDEAEFDMLNFGHGSIGSAGQMLYSPESAWDRWELWFENERDTIIRGEADFP
ncbi:MAG: hypothetical protein QGF46_03155, partial [Planctomycetota bacterium]|nr:hypothetical protein [Planctomycetota bacterium]